MQVCRGREERLASFRVDPCEVSSPSPRTQGYYRRRGEDHLQSLSEITLGDNGDIHSGPGSGLDPQGGK